MGHYITAQQRRRALFFETLQQTRSVARAAKVAGIGRGTAYNWRKTDAAFCDEWDRIMSRKLPSDIEAQRKAFLERATKPPRKGIRPSTERLLVQRFVPHLDRIAAFFHWPSIQQATVNYKLPNRKLLDVFLLHSDGTRTIIEVKSCMKVRASHYGWLAYQCIGQSLYYFESLCDDGIPADKIRLCVLTDYDHDMYFRRAVQHIDVPFFFGNVLTILDGRL